MRYIINLVIIFIFKLLRKIRKGKSYILKIQSSKRILSLNFKKEINFVQVGANDGISFDFLYDFLKSLDSKGLVIEPVKDYYYELCENYKYNPNIITINKAVHISEKQILIYKISPDAIEKYPDWAKGIASLDKFHHLKINILSEDIITEVVDADTLSNILKANLKNSSLDYFQIDTEGYDFEVLKMINFTIFKPKIIKYESVNLTPDCKNQAYYFLKSKGYFLFEELGDTVALDIKKVRLL